MLFDLDTFTASHLQNYIDTPCEDRIVGFGCLSVLPAKYSCS